MQIATVALLAILVGFEIYRLYCSRRRTSKKDYFENMLHGTQRMIWDAEFKRFKTAEIREDVRKEYDHACRSVFNYEERIKNWTEKDGNEDERKRVEDDIVLAKRDIERFEAQLKMMDLEINGSAPTNELPDGYTGINNNIDSMRELTEMLTDWIKRL